MRLRGWALGIVLLAFALRVVGLDAQELRGDEAFGYFFSLPSLDEIVTQTLALAEPHPVGSYWLQHAWLGWAGHSEYALRFTSAWWSVLAVGLLLRMAQQLQANALSITSAGLLFALSPYAIWHAQDARMYSMSMALTLASTLLAVRWWHRPHWQIGIAYILVTWLALQTHYYGVYVVLAQGIGFGSSLLWQRAWRRTVAWWVLQGLVLLLWLPWLWLARNILSGYGGNGDSPTMLDALARSLSVLLVGETIPAAQQWPYALLTLLALGIGAWGWWHTNRFSFWLLLVWVIVPLAAIWISAQSRPIFNERYLVTIAPPLYLLVAGSGSTLAERWQGWRGAQRGLLLLVGIVMIAGLVRYASDPAYSKTRGWRELAAALVELSAGRDPTSVRLAQNYPDPTLWYYYRGLVDHLVLPPQPRDAAGAAREVAQMVTDGVARVVLVQQPDPAWDSGNIAADALGAAYTPVAVREVGQWPVQLYLRPPSELDNADVRYTNGLHITQLALLPASLPPGGLLEVHLRWDAAAATLRGSEAVSLQLLDGTGQLVAQRDQPLVQGPPPAATMNSYGILIPDNLAPGMYAVSLVLYDPAQAGSPRLTTLAGDDHHLLGTVVVREEVVVAVRE